MFPSSPSLARVSYQNAHEVVCTDSSFVYEMLYLNGRRLPVNLATGFPLGKTGVGAVPTCWLDVFLAIFGIWCLS